MRTNELLLALAQGHGGIDIHLDKRRATVATNYQPFVKGVGTTLFDAAHDCAQWIYKVIEDKPEYRVKIQDVLDAFALTTEDVNEH